MKIKTVNLNQFKRFTDLTITDIPESTKLVIIAGPNGCGKSSLFDGMKSWHQNWKGQGQNWIQDYHSKQGSGISQNNIDNTVKVTVHGQEPPANTEERKKALYIRTAYRNDPQIQVGSLQKVGSQLDENRFNSSYSGGQIKGNFERKYLQNIFALASGGFNNGL
jgi:AAA15 family ATPase/GTPase